MKPQHAATHLFGVFCFAFAIAASAPARAQLPPALDDEIVSRDESDFDVTATTGAISGDGRYALFNTGSGLYRRDRVDGTTQRVDTTAADVPANANPGPTRPAISPDGRFVSFDTYASNLAADSNNEPDIYLKDMDTGAIVRVSITTGGGDIGDIVYCTESAVSADGNRIAFVCEAANAIPTVYLRDRSAGTTTTISINLSAGISLSSTSASPSISADGRYVGFVSDAPDLVAGDSNGEADAFVRDTDNGTTFRVSLNATGDEITGGNTHRVDLADACVAAFEHDSNSVIDGDTDGVSDVFVRDWCAATTEVVSVDSNGFGTSSASGKPSISADGRYVAFYSNGNLDGAFDFTGGSDVYVHDRITGDTARANLQSVQDLEFDSFATAPGLSADGRQLVYQTAGGFVADRMLAVRNPVVELLPEESVDVVAYGSSANADSLSASVSADGRMVVFASDSQGFDRGWNGSDGDSVRDIFVYDAQADCVQQASMSDGVANGGNCVNGKRPSWANKGGCVAPEICSAAIEPAIDAAGRKVVFVTQDGAVAKYANETPEQRLQRRQKGVDYAVVLRNLVTNATYRIGTANSAGVGTTPRLAPGGTGLVFVSNAPLIGSDSNGQPDVYRQRINPDGSPNSTPECVSCKDGNNATIPGGSANPAISADGNTVAFDVPNGVGGRDILIRNLVTGATQRVGITAPAATRMSTAPQLDWNGTRVAFQSGATLTPGDANAFEDVYVFDASGARLSLFSGGNGPSKSPVISGDGKTIAYITEASDLDPNAHDGNGFQDMHVQEVVGGTLTGGRRATLARNRRGAYGNGPSFRPAISYNGTVVAFDSAASNLTADEADNNGALDVFVRSVPFNADRVFENGFE